MKSKILFLLLYLTQTLSAQTFTEMTGTPFDGVYHSSVAFSDVDGDSDQDLLITGRNSLNEGIAKLYTNDGMGNFTEMIGTPFDGVYFSSIAFSDVDGDNDQDLLITGGDIGSIAKLYTNDGMGNFTETPSTPFDSVESSSVAFSDVDGDSDQDLLITGNSSGEEIAKLYTNDGMGNFTEMMGTPFVGVELSSIAFSDVDGDSDQDLVITGQNSSFEPIAKLYTNDGVGNFTEIIGTPFDGVRRGAIAFSDVDGDNDQDLFIAGITGPNGANEPIAKLYTNNGIGNFTEMMGTPFDGLFFSTIAFSDIDGDNDQDLLITGNISAEGITKMYTNDGMGNFTETMGNPFDGVTYSSIAFSDVDVDGDPDVLITGSKGWAVIEPIAKLYINDGMVSSIDNETLGFNLECTLYPNPSKSNNLNMRFESTESGFAIVKVYDINGHLLSQQKEFAVIGEQTISIDISSLSPGSYFIQLDKDKRKGAAKFIVQ
jgi:hypothetical protein